MTQPNLPPGRPILGARSAEIGPTSDALFSSHASQSVPASVPVDNITNSRRPPISQMFSSAPSAPACVLPPNIDTSLPPPFIPGNFPVTEQFTPSVLASSNAKSVPSINSVQTSLSNLNVNAREFVPQNYAVPTGPNEDYYGNEANYQYNNDEWEDESYLDSVYYIRYGMDMLNSQPEIFDSIMPELTASLEKCIYDEYSLTAAINEIIEQAIAEPNFRYTASKMCDHLSQNLEASSPSGTFRQHLLKWCHMEFERRETMITNAQLRERLIGFTLFFSELFINLTFTKKLQKAERIPLLGLAVKQLVMTLLSKPVDSTLKCVGQVLKLTGSALSELEDTTVDESLPLKNVIQSLKNTIVDVKCDRGIKSMLIGIIELNANNWGRETDAVDNAGATNIPAQIGTTYYDQGRPVMKPDEDDCQYSNQQITEEDLREQEQFLNELMGDGDHSNFEDSEYDDEIAAAYELFLKDSEQKSHRR